TCAGQDRAGAASARLGQEAPHPVDEVDGIAGFGDVVGGAGLEAELDVERRGLGRQEDHGRTTQVVVSHQLAHHLHTVELRHHDVENNDIGLPGAHGLETLDAVACGQDVEAFGLEAQLQHSPHDGVVVDDEDARLGHV